MKEWKKVVRVKAKSLQDLSEQEGRVTLSKEKEFYVYVLLDPRYPGDYIYFLEDVKLTLTHRPFYVGKGKRNRIRDHANNARRHPAPVRGDSKGNLIRKLHKLGLEPVELIVSSNTTESVALAKEIFLIDAIGRKNNKTGLLTNISSGGDGSNTGAPRTKEWNNKISQALKGRIKTDLEIERISKALTGRTFSQTHRAKLKIHNSTRVRAPHSEKTKAKMSASASGKIFSEETRRRMSEAARNRIRKPLSEETKALMRLAALGRVQSDETKAKLRAHNLGKKASEATRAKLREARQRQKV